jgi:DNA gyrase/topoisomerase IV subunit B
MNIAKTEDFRGTLRINDMWMGTRVLERKIMWNIPIGKSVPQLSEIYFCCSYLQSIKELIFNAIDRFIDKSRDEYPYKTTEIIITFDTKTGNFSVLNNGMGFNIDMREDGIYNPEACYGQQHTSTNYNKSTDSISNGTHGLGAKCTSQTSRLFKITTVDSGHRRVDGIIKEVHSKRIYIQEFHDGRPSPPRINDVSDRPIPPHTKVEVVPDMSFFTFNREWSEEIGNDFIAYLRMYLTLIKIECSELRIVINNSEIPNIEIYGDHKTILLPVLRDPIYSWKVGLSTCSTTKPKHSDMIMVNSVHMEEMPDIIDYLQNQIWDYVQATIKKKKIILGRLMRKDVSDHVIISFIAFIPGTRPTAQNKMSISLTNPEYPRNFILGAEILNNLFDDILPILDHINRIRAINNTAKKTIKLDKVVKARYLRSNNVPSNEDRPFSLIVAEGDSHCNMILNSMKSPNLRDKLGYDPRCYYSVMSLGGVPKNLFKHIDIGELLKVIESNGSKNIADSLSMKLLNKIKDEKSNAGFLSMMKVLGLNISEDTGEFPVCSKKNKSRYSSIIIATDQDHDGSYIRTLVLANIIAFWPRLLKNLRIHVAYTPVIRVRPPKPGVNPKTLAPYNPNKVLEFMTIVDYENWAISMFRTTKVPKCWGVKYNKGLGSNSKEEGIWATRDILEKCVPFAPDNNWLNSINACVGPSAVLRRQFMAQTRIVNEIATRKSLPTKQIT